MTDAELGRRAVACARWRWMPGMLAKHPAFEGYRVSHVGLTGMHGVCRWGDFERAVVALPLPNSVDVLPDLDDQATLGCLLALVKQAWDRRDVFGLLYHSDAGWVVEANDLHFYGHTEAEALVAALEAAP